MRNLKKIVSSGCFFLCLGGWVYSGQLNGAQEATQATPTAAGREAVLNAAVSQAINAGTSDKPEGDAVVQAAEAPAAQAVTTSGAPVSGAPASAAATAPAKDLGQNVVDVDVAG